MDDVTCAYLAGVMDSDGWFTISRHTTKSRYGDCFTYSESAGCGQTRPDAVRLLHAEFGGTLRLRTREGTTGNWRPIYYWAVTNTLAAKAAAALRPFLRVKTEQADLILAIRASKSEPYDERRTVPTGRPRGRALHPDIVAARHAAYLRIRALNDRRPSNIALESPVA